MTDASVQEVTAPAHEPSDGNEVNHLVCCRRSWSRAFCGLSTDGHPINLHSDFICTMCLEEAERQLGGLPLDGRICPTDRMPCPDDDEIDIRISWEIS